jgi:hypothetical protein
LHGLLFFSPSITLIQLYWEIILTYIIPNYFQFWTLLPILFGIMPLVVFSKIKDWQAIMMKWISGGKIDEKRFYNLKKFLILLIRIFKNLSIWFSTIIIVVLIHMIALSALSELHLPDMYIPPFLIIFIMIFPFLCLLLTLVSARVLSNWINRIYNIITTKTMQKNIIPAYKSLKRWTIFYQLLILSIGVLNYFYVAAGAKMGDIEMVEGFALLALYGFFALTLEWGRRFTYYTTAHAEKIST